MSDVMIEAKGLVKRYGNFVALNNVNFEVKRGEILGFLGPNGAGKTTTMKILTCFISPTEGTAKINGCDVWSDSIGARSAVGYLPESTPLYKEMMVLEYLEFVARMRGLGDNSRARIKKVCEETGLVDVIAKHIGELSKGYKQRVGLAQALIHEPPILILDEPLSGLDPNQADEIRDLIRALGKERTVILSTHHLAEVQVVCDRVLIISKGRIVADDKPQELVDRAGHSRFIVSVAKTEAVTAEGARETLSKIEFEGARPSAVRIHKDSSGDEIVLEVVPAKESDLRAAIFRAAVASNLTLIGLRREGQNLEQIFRDLTLAGGTDNKSPSKEAA